MTVHPFRPIVLAGITFAALSMLLPFASFPALGPVDGLSADAWPALVPLVPVLVMTVTGSWEHGWDAMPGVTAIVLSAATLVFAVVKLGDAVVASRSTPGARLGAGPWVLVAAAAVIIGGSAYGALADAPSRNVYHSADS